MNDETNVESTPEPAAAAATGPLVTRRDCTVLGAKVFAICVAAGIVVSLLPASAAVLVQAPLLADECLKTLLIAVYIGVPPAAAIGGGIGFELYRLAARSREPREVGCLMWVVLGLCVLGWTAPLFYAQYWRRRKTIIEAGRVGWVGPVLYGMLLVVVACLCLILVLHGDAKAVAARFCEAMIPAPIYGGLISLFLADCIVVNLIAKLYQQERLAAPHTHNIQYSLATLLYGSLALGAYGTGLVLIFGN